MSEVQSRGQAPRGRGLFRGGRGGYRGTRGGAKTHGRYEDQETAPSVEDQGEIGELKAKYADKLPLLREICEGWNDEDLAFALQESDGDVELVLDKITSGMISPWGEVKKKSGKSKEAGVSPFDSNARGRGRGSAEGRGRGRGAERGVRAGRGTRSVSQANGTKTAEKPMKTTEEAFGDLLVPASTTIDTKPTNGDSTATGGGMHSASKDVPKPLVAEDSKPTSTTTASTGKMGGWAKLFDKPAPPPAPKKASPPPVPSPVMSAAAIEETAPVPTAEEPLTEHLPTPPIESTQVEDSAGELPSAPHSDSPVPDIAPSHDQLTEKNLDKLPDVSIPPQTITVASTTASTQDPLNPALPAAPIIRPGMSGYAASALKATTATGRSASYSRKIMDQQEAVVMPGNHAVDRTAVQFGKMGLNGDDVDADEDREEPETRTQLPDDSPAAPRASLPPAMPETKAPAEAAAEEAPVVRPAPGLPPAPHQQNNAQQPPSPQQSSTYSDQYRYGQGQKSYDPFIQQPQSQTSASEPFSNQVPGQSQTAAASAQDYSQYYGANREAYQQYYGYGQVQDNQRGNGTTGSASTQDAQVQYANTRSQQQQAYNQSDSQNSGGNTPNPTSASHQTQPSQHVPSQGNYGGHPYGYPNAYGQQYPQYGNSYMGNMNHRYGANRPLFDDVRRDNDYYGNQYGYGHNQQYGSNYKSNMYSQPQHQYSHDYSSSPANNTGIGGREYGRAGSTQPSEGQQSASTGNNAFGGMADPFGRTSSGFGQSQTHAGHQGSDEPSKTSGPSPSLQGGRPGSALNNMSSQQSGLGHPQSQHSNQGFGGYQQYSGFGNQSHQHSGYSNYGSNAAFSGYGYGGRGGWTGYGAGQH